MASLTCCAAHALNADDLSFRSAILIVSSTSSSPLATLVLEAEALDSLLLSSSALVCVLFDEWPAKRSSDDESTKTLPWRIKRFCRLLLQSSRSLPLSDDWLAIMIIFEWSFQAASERKRCNQLVGKYGWVGFWDGSGFVGFRST